MNYDISAMYVSTLILDEKFKKMSREAAEETAEKQSILARFFRKLCLS
ncbi:hypothetical protein [Vibrio sp. MA40-2]